MALAADTVIAEVENIVEIGEIDPDDVTIPGVVVDMIVQGKGGVVNG
jgi:acetate CoA/acetoacetate CoA-transferase alpha subunit